MLIIVSGLSGSGKSVAIRILEDLGYYCVDNIPVELFPTLSESLKKHHHHSAISLDVRNLEFYDHNLNTILQRISESNETKLLFFTADKQTLIRRYSNTRRRHPLSKNGLSLEEGINKEIETLSPILSLADVIIDTSALSVHDLANVLAERLHLPQKKPLTISFESFGFKYTLPSNADYVFDVRFLPNPHWEKDLKDLTGKDQPVIEYLNNSALVQDFLQETIHYLEKWLPYLENNNRSYLNIAIGCTGGQHRSVYVAEKLAEHFSKTRQDIRIKHHTFSKQLQQPETILAK